MRRKEERQERVRQMEKGQTKGGRERLQVTTEDAPVTGTISYTTLTLTSPLTILHHH